MLLRRAIAGLRHAGQRVGLLAPRAAAPALLDESGSGVAEAYDFDAAWFASLAGGHPGDEARAVLRRFDAALAYTRQVALIEGLRDGGLEVVAQPPEPVGMHASAWLAQPTRRWGAEPLPGIPPPLRPTPEEDAAASDLMRSLGLAPGFLALHPGSGSAAKNWSPERFADLAAQLAPRGERWLLVAGPADAVATAPLAELAGAALGRGLSLRTLGALLARSGLYVGNDSGVTHLAAAFDAPTLALFGPSNPALYAPVGGWVSIVCSPTGAMDGLCVGTVVAAARALRSAADAPRAG